MIYRELEFDINRRISVRVCRRDIAFWECECDVYNLEDGIASFHEIIKFKSSTSLYSALVYCVIKANLPMDDNSYDALEEFSEQLWYNVSA